MEPDHGHTNKVSWWAAKFASEMFPPNSTDIAKLHTLSIPLNRDLLRGLQRYTVQIPPRLRDDNIRSFESLRDGQFHALISTDLNYSKDFGLTCDDKDTSNTKLICE